MVISQNNFENHVKRELRSLLRRLPNDLKDAAINIAVCTADRPSKYQSDGTDGSDLLGLYEGVPINERRSDDAHLPDKITLFRIPLMESCANESKLRKEIRMTLIHELGHALGFDEDDLIERGLE